MDWGSAGTWVIGLVGAVIAYLQYRNSIFIPEVQAYTARATADLPGRKKVFLRVTNKGGASGMVDGVYAVDAWHKPLQNLSFTWTGWEERTPVPFSLPGKSAAWLAIEFKASLPANAGITVQFGAHGSRCGGLTEVDIAPSMRTALPPGSLGIIEPPRTT